MQHPAGESDDGPLRLGFDRRLKLEFHGSRITSDAGLLAYRDLDDALGLTDLAGGVLSECRRGRNTRHLPTGLLRQSVFGRLAGYEDVNDAERLAHDPAMRAVVDRGGLDRQAASASQMGRFETEWLTGEANLAALADLSGAWIDRVHARRPQTTIVLDIDSSVSETHGAQEGSAYNGHFGCTCYHPLFVFNQFGDLERCALRPGNVHSADGWRAVLEPVVARYRGKVKHLYFRADAAFAGPEIYEFLEAQSIKYAIRLPANRVLQESIAFLLRRPVGRPPHEVRRFHASFHYQAGSWTKPRRVVAKVEWHPGELYPRVGTAASIRGMSVRGDADMSVIISTDNPMDFLSSANRANTLEAVRTAEPRAQFLKYSKLERELLKRTRNSSEFIIPTPADQFGLIGLGHQWKSVCGLMVSASSRRQRSATTASSSASVAKCRLATGSSTSGQRCSAGCSSGL